MARSQTNFAWATLIDLHEDVSGESDRAPIRDRLIRTLRRAIREGRLTDGAALPPSRALADELGCSRWVVTEAYGQLAVEGYLTARVGSATRVSWTPGGRPSGTPDGAPGRGRTSAPKVQAVRLDLAPGLPDLRAFPRRRWAEAVRAVTTSMAYPDLGVLDPAGHSALRTTLSEYLCRARGADCRPGSVSVCGGVTDGLVRVCRALRAEGLTDLAIEDPGWGRLRTAATSAGMRVHPVGVDDAGLRVAELADRPRVRAVVVGAAHQFPLGCALAADRRSALVNWARSARGVIIEDDYDAEFRYDRRPVGVMQGMDPTRVFLLGSVSKTLSPALGLGWLVAPGSWLATVRDANPVTSAPPVLDQLALANFIDRGWYDAHLRAVRRRYRTRRDLLIAALAKQVPAVRPAGTAAGLHVLLHLPVGADAAAIVSAARAGGLEVMDLNEYRVRPGSPGLVLGYGNIADLDIPRAVAILASALA